MMVLLITMMLCSLQHAKTLVDVRLSVGQLNQHQMRHYGKLLLHAAFGRRSGIPVPSRQTTLDEGQGDHFSLVVIVIVAVVVDITFVAVDVGVGGHLVFPGLYFVTLLGHFLSVGRITVR